MIFVKNKSIGKVLANENVLSIDATNKWKQNDTT